MTCVSKKSKLKSLLSAVPEIGEGPKFKKWVAGDPDHVPKVRYTLATKSTFALSGDKSATKSTVADMVNFVADTVDFVASVYRALGWQFSFRIVLVTIHLHIKSEVSCSTVCSYSSSHRCEPSIRHSQPC